MNGLHVPRGPTAERQWRQRGIARGRGVGALCPERANRRKAMETWNSPAGVIARNVSPERANRRKAMETTAHVTISFCQSNRVPRGPTAERQWRPARGRGALCYSEKSREGQPPKGNGDSPSNIGTVADHTTGPERANRRKAMETAPSPTTPRRRGAWSREGQPPKGNGDLMLMVVLLVHALTSREGQPPKGNGDRRSLWTAELSLSCPERANRRKAMETAPWLFRP